jgi:hypothetical protein
MTVALRRSTTFSAPLIVEASTDGGATFTLPVGDTIRLATANEYLLIELPLPAVLEGRTALFRWRIIPAGTGTTATIRLDDVAITAHPLFDLALRSPACVPRSPRSGETLQVSVVVVNTGARRPGEAVLDLFLDRDADGMPGVAEPFASSPLTLLPPPGDSTVARCTLGPIAAGPGVLRMRLRTVDDGDPGNDTLSLPCPVSPVRGAVVLNELMYAPSPGEPEWVELLNTGEEEADIGGWTLSDASSTRMLPASPVVLPPGGFAVLTRDSAALTGIRPAARGAIVPLTGFPSLNNGGDMVVLRDATGETADSTWYLSSWGGGEGGVSLERRDPLYAPTDASNWGPAVDSSGATPGLPNSIRALQTDGGLERTSAAIHASSDAVTIRVTVKNFGTRLLPPITLELVGARDDIGSGEGEIVLVQTSFAGELPPRGSVSLGLLWPHPPPGLHHLVLRVRCPSDLRQENDTLRVSTWVPPPAGVLVLNEIMAAPAPGGAEYIELLHCGAGSLELGDVRVAGATLRPPRAAIMRPGMYALIASDSSVFRTFPWLSGSTSCVTLISTSALGLSNSGDSVVPRGPDGRAFDSLWYDPAWHHPAQSTTTGKSLEKIVPGSPAGDGSTWSTSVDPLGGTPGRRNSIATPAVRATSRLVCSPTPFSPDGDGRDDFTVIHYDLPEPLPAVSVTIYDVRGRVVRRLTAYAPSGSAGDVVWDGYDDGRHPARTGVYVVLLEAGSTGSDAILRERCSVVVARRL